MNIETEVLASGAVLRLSGRLDAASAGQLQAAAGELVRDGRHRLRLDAAQLEYLSSAGLRVLVRLRRDLDAVHGSLAIVQPSAFVRDTLRMSGLESLLAAAADTPRAEPPPAAPTAAAVDPIAGMAIETHRLDAAGRIALDVHVGWTPWQALGPAAYRDVALARPRFGLGIGAPAPTAADAARRLGDFVAAAGCVAWLPTDGAETPDFLEQAAQFVPRLQTVQALVGTGTFSHLLRFRPRDGAAVAHLDELLAQALTETGAEAVAAVVLAEAEGLVGAALSRSPASLNRGEQPGEFPAIRDWIAFCGERLYRRTQTLVVAFAGRGAAAASLPTLAPWPGTDLHLHAHVMAWPFRPFPQGVVDLETAVAAVTTDSAPLGLLHLLADDRPLVGLGRSAFVRGACWCAPLQPLSEVRR
jgi:anti-anti-sigma factor